MNKDLLKKTLPHLVAVVLFLIIAAIYSKPLLQGKKLATNDYNVYSAISKANTDYEKENDRLVFWNNSMFSGMPTYAISTAKQDNIFNKIYMVLIFGKSVPLNIIFWYLLGFYIMLNAFKVNPWLSILGALAFAFSSYYFVIIAAGHFTKAIAIGFMAPILGGVYMAFDQKRPWAGMFLMSFFMALQILSNHVQITYYTGLTILIFGIFEFVWAIKEKYMLRFAKTVGILAIGLGLAVGINAAFIMTTQEYIPYSIRGASELSAPKADKTSGLDKSYATYWSYGIDETFTLLIPNVKGGASVSKISEESATYQTIDKTLSQYYGAEGSAWVKENITQFPAYFGDQPGTSGPVYAGAFIVFLFVFGLLIVKGKVKWWLLTVTIVSILLSWGKNLDFLTHFFLNYFPGYNKFRTVTMILVLAETTIPLLAILALVEVFKKKIDSKKMLNYFYIALGITGLATMVFIIAPSVAGLSGVDKTEVALAENLSKNIQDKDGQAAFKNEIVNSMYQDRADMVRNDAMRSLAFIILGAAVVFLVIKTKLKPNLAIAIMAVIVLADMWTINRRYLNDDNFVPKREYEVPYAKSKADEAILKDSDPDYRVCNFTVSIFNDGSTSFYHKSIGGYSGAKMRRYQELFDSNIQTEMSNVIAVVNRGSNLTMQDLQSTLDEQNNTHVLNMLNTKYFILNPEYPPLKNNHALGNAWFVGEYKYAENADGEIAVMKTLDPAVEAVIDRKFQDQLKGFAPKLDSTATIVLKEYAPDYLVYESNTSTEQLAVFSEIYYPHGWVVTVDGNEASHFRANYVLRAMRVPAGKHTIKFSFEPPVYKKGVAISYACSITLFLMIFAGAFFEYKKKKGKKGMTDV